MDPRSHGDSLLAHHLPPELLLEVFALYITESHESENDSNSATFPNTNEGAWLLTHVCHDWREIVVSTARFWSDIRVVLDLKRNSGRWPKPKDRYISYLVHLISLQVERSRDLPVSISVYLSALWQKRDLCPLSEILLLCRQRWKRLRLAGTGIKDLYNSISSLISSPLECPLLEQWRSDQMGHREVEFPISGLFSHHDCPRLKTVHFRHSYPSISQLPWPQIESLTIASLFGVDDFLPDMHAHLTNLTKLCIWECEWMTLPSEAYILPRLRSLQLSGNFFNQLEGMYAIATPALEELCIGKILKPTPWIPAMKAFIKRSQCSITSFRCHVAYEIKPFLPMLQMMSSLQQLQLHLGADRPEFRFFVDAFNLTDDNSMSFLYCPQLHQLTLRLGWTIHDGLGQDLSPLFAMLEGRSVSACVSRGFPLGLQTVKLVGRRGWDRADDISTGLLCLRNRGLDVIAGQPSDWTGY